MASTLQHHAARAGEVDAYIRAIEFFFHNKRRIRDERLGFLAAKVFVIVSTLRAEQVRSTGILNKIISGSAHCCNWISNSLLSYTQCAPGWASHSE
jgi:hypothetical protein